MTTMESRATPRGSRAMHSDIPPSRFPFAEQLAQRVHVVGDIDVDLGTWLDEYRGATCSRYGPSIEEAQAAEVVIADRIGGGVPDLPSSASSTAWAREPKMLRGVPRWKM